MEQRVTLSPDAIFELLVDRRRRFVLHYLRMAENDVVQLDALIEWVAEQLDERDDPSEARREQLETSLHHVHLPQLAESGVLDYDWRSRAIRYRACPDLETHLELVQTTDLS